MTRILFVLLATALLTATCARRRPSEPPTPPPAEILHASYAVDPARWPAPHVDTSVRYVELGPLPAVTYPADNPYHPAKAELGKLLFFDPRLSSSNQIACASCHDPELGWGDGRRVAYGHNRQTGRRNAMTLLNVGHFDRFFWDGRARSLEHQATFPVQDQLEMNAYLRTVEEKLNAVPAYRDRFRAVFGADSVAMPDVARALATFQRGIVSRPSRFDRFVTSDRQLLTDQELLGLHLFRTKARCVNCHLGPRFSDGLFHNDGFTQFRRNGQDLGLYDLTGDTADVGRFRTPSLRDVAFTGPWMHNGNMFSLREIVDMYGEGMPNPVPRGAQNDPLRPHNSPLLRPLHLTDEEKEALVAFLGALSTRPHRVSPPQLP